MKYPETSARRFAAALGPAAAGIVGDSAEAQASPDRLVRAVARFLRRLHSLPPEGPDVSATALLDLAQRRCADGAVDARRFDEPYRLVTPDRLLQAAQALRPPDVASTMVLGARTLDHLDLAGDEVVGWRAGTHWGVGDPAMDVAWMAAAIAATCGPPFVVAFAETYGDAAPGPLRSEFWITLGQLL